MITAPALLAVLEGARNGRVVGVAPAISYAGRRLLATLRKGLLAGLVYTAQFALGVLIIVLGTSTSFPVAISVLIFIPYLIYLLPVSPVLVAAATIGDPNKNSVWHGLRLFVADWPTAAGAFYLVGLVLFFVSIGAAIISLIPFFGILVQLALTVVQYGMCAANSLLIWIRLGGDIDPALTQLVEEAPPE